MSGPFTREEIEQIVRGNFICSPFIAAESTQGPGNLQNPGFAGIFRREVKTTLTIGSHRSIRSLKRENFLQYLTQRQWWLNG